MTPEQVSALSDNELNRAMIWLYPPEDGVIYNGAIDMYLSRYRAMDYLSSYDLAMPLAIKERLTITTGFSGDSYRVGLTNGCYAAIGNNPPIVDMWFFNDNPLRAICECLVLIALADK